MTSEIYLEAKIDIYLSFIYQLISANATMYRNSDFVLVLSMKVGKKHPQKLDTAKMQKCPVPPKSAMSAQTVENSHGFLMFPILVTNL